MRVYRSVWLLICVTAGALGMIITWSSVTVAGQVGVATFSAILTAIAYQLRRTQRAAAPAPDWRRLSEISAAGAVSGLALIGPVMVMGGTAVASALLLAVASPLAIRWSLARLGALPACVPSAVVDDDDQATSSHPGTSWSARRPAPADHVVGQLSNDELCRAWRLSFTALQRATTTAKQVQLVAARQELLDEMERRNPAGFSRWLHAGARPAGDPSRYLNRT